MLLLMPFSSLHEVENRLGDPTPLTPQEVRELLPWMNQIGESGTRRLDVRLALQNLETGQKFERSINRLRNWLIALAILLVVLTGTTVYNSAVLVHWTGMTRQPLVAQESESAAAPASSGKKTLGPWKVKFGIPGSAEVPEKSPILKCTFAEDANAGLGYIDVTAANLSDRSYSVRYNIYGYDQEGRRVSEGNDEFTIGRRETVLRKIFLVSQQSVQVQGQLGSVFSIQATLEQ